MSQPTKPDLTANTVADGAADPAMQGEGNYTATRRHRLSVKRFVASGKVDAAAHSAAPRNDEEAKALLDAEQAGLSHAKK